jgi:magnesium chelatase subunit D
LKGTLQVSSYSLSLELVKRLQQANLVSSTVTSEAAQRVIDYFSFSDSYSIRRELALLRLAQVNARFEGSSEIREFHVDMAAKSIGLNIDELVDGDKSVLEPDKPIKSETPESAAVVGGEEADSTSKFSNLKPIKETVDGLEGEDEIFEQDVVLQMGNPYREDEAYVQRDATSLRLPLRRLRVMGHSGWG